MSTGPTIDVHAHVMVPEVEVAVCGQPGLAAHRALALRHHGIESATESARVMAHRIVQLTDLGRRLRDMDAAGVDVQVLSPAPEQYHYWTDEELARRVTKRANRGVAAAVSQAPHRFAGLGLVPLHHPDLVIAALHDAVIECGLRGVEFSSHAHGVELSDERLEPFWSAAEELGAVLFLHPDGCSLDGRLNRFYLCDTVGQPAETATGLSHLIFAGVLDRHPGLRIVAAHGGGYLPTFIGRSDHAWQVRPDARGCAQPPSRYLRRLHFDSVVHSPAALRALVDAVGAGQVLLGSDYPFETGVEDPLRRLRFSGVEPGAQEAIRSANAVRLGLGPPVNSELNDQ